MTKNKPPKLQVLLRNNGGATYILLHRGDQWSVKIRMNEAITLADNLVDAFEQVDQQQENR